MQNKRQIHFKRFWLTAVALILFVMLMACTETGVNTLPAVSDYMPDEIVEIKDLRVGVVSGPYWDMFAEAILPSLQQMGYTATFVYYHDYASPNFALARNEIDLNVFQHYAYLNTFKLENDLALTAVMEIPTISMSIFSNRFSSLDEIKAGITESIPTGITASIPDDASNLARALRVLEDANLITLCPSIDKSRAVLADISLNPYNIQITPVSAHQLVEFFYNYCISVIPGNFAISSNLNLAEALYRELLTANYYIVAAVRTEDLNKQFVRDIIDIIYSESFRDVIVDPDGSYALFQWPRWLHDAVSVSR
ncbi:MAG: MetQ/NlpA family ABC transporter substrate-binding protein [Oscillospiraceae bacterium]|nr:MetQ/NlpA family ABC transporter substrate-binding protein [Oscillospiraceae bacterium]